MKKFIISLILLFSGSDVLAIRDATFERRGEVPSSVFRTLQALSCGEDNCLEMPYPIASSPVDSDRYNQYLYSDHFRVVYSSLCNGNQSVESYANRMLEIAEIVYQKEVVEMGLRPPAGNEQYFIDIFLGRKSRSEDCRGTDYVSGSIIDWPFSYIDTYAGYAAEHPRTEAVAYLVMNAGLTDELLQVTLAHEIHHTIQFAYKHFENSFFSDSYLDEDLWILEAMATAMEKQVFPEVDDYVYYVNRWYETMDHPLDSFNGVHEYGASIWILFLINELSNDVAHNILSLFIAENGWQQILEQVASDSETTLPDLFSRFISAVWNPEDHFTHGDQFNQDAIAESTVRVSPEQSLILNKYGIQPVTFSEDTSLTFDDLVHKWDPPQQSYCDDWNGSSIRRLLCRTGKSLVLFSEKSSQRLSTPYLDLELRKGWNLVSFLTEDQRLASDVLEGPYVQVEDDVWSGSLLEDQTDPIKVLGSGWLFSSQEQSIRTLGDRMMTDYTHLDLGWNLIKVPGSGLGTPSDHDQLIDQVAQKSGYSLQRLLYQSEEGRWLIVDYERAIGAYEVSEQVSAIWAYLQ